MSGIDSKPIIAGSCCRQLANVSKGTCVGKTADFQPINCYTVKARHIVTIEDYLKVA